MIELDKRQDVKNRGMRDAVHVQIVIVQSEYPLYPGQPVRFVDTNYDYVVPSAMGRAHAVVNPFMPGFDQDEPFAVLLLPGMSRDLLHTFTLNIPDVPPGKVVATTHPDKTVIANLEEKVRTLREKNERLEEELYRSGVTFDPEEEGDGWSDGCGPGCG